ncbi:DUF6232 family protein [Aeromonas enteropelogenes]|uniref:DUF6232 family protein n=1 Tax=Aeromonas enteropelogenes TaxID=29489 RepID=UPI003BA2E5C4
MENSIIFNENGVSVSNTRFVVDDQTYAINTVTSVKFETIEPKRIFASLLTFAGIIAFFVSTPIFALSLLALSLFFGIKAKKEYAVVLNTSSGESKALVSKDKKYIENVILAINKAIVNRG